ncbi:P-loop containing nucleoside triphosphate hydrolase protein [Dunaliella salina]|uniref:P-loop containing nucleoside triphosphate hydrolase protein n=1 Tax=Dunaliella salina TaxID=3046 RepID=A0ABQ7GPQ3_DUNSA|nr:P-loop containing nucleoside triphosphate hydrolase protein [Dunaliella salina]|eukprot:KAF5836580.1 P-loop containing nucleoside triphosphate hydrolase protein [Dunaliella salina]
MLLPRQLQHVRGAAAASLSPRPLPALRAPPSCSRSVPRACSSSLVLQSLSSIKSFPGAPLRQCSLSLQPGRRHMAVRAAQGGAEGRRITQNEFTDKAWQAIVAAPDIAKAYSQQIVETEHLLKALLEQPNGLARRIASKAGSEATALLDLTDKYIRQQPKVSGDSSQVLGRNLEGVVNRAMELKDKWGDQYVSVEHLVLALADDPRFGAMLFKNEGLTNKKLEEAIKEIRGSNKVLDQDPEGKYEALTKYARDLTQAARDGKLDPVIGRDDEVRRCIQILSRRTKNNPVLIGEPGVGKTAVAEGLAQRIVSNDVPEALQGRMLMALDMGQLIAGAKFRGEFEDRLKSVIKEVTDSAGKIVLFIDEIHTVVGAGASEGSMDAGNLLKPMLGRGELRCIGATTLDEYRRYIEKDPALERRFQQVYVDQPTVAQTVSILRGLRERYELHHGVRINDSALVEAAVLSDRYIADRFLPDKAIDLVDEAAAKLKMEITSKPEVLDEVDRKVLQLEMERLSLNKADDKDKAAKSRLSLLDLELSQLKKDQAEITEKWQAEKQEMGRVQDLKEEIERVNLEVAAAEREYDLNRAAELKYGTSLELNKQLKVRIDMSEYMEKHSVSRLIGAPPGYVGFEEGGQLTEAVRRRPYSVLLFDEMEKAHGDVFNILLQILDDGRVTDSQGRYVSFKNTIIIMTSNLGSDLILEAGDNREMMRAMVMAACRANFRPEFINRVDEFIIFDPLAQDQIKQIVRMQADRVGERLADKKMRLELTEAALDHLAKVSYDPVYGARPVKRAVQRELETTIAKALLRGDFVEEDTVMVDADEAGLLLSKGGAPATPPPGELQFQ